MLRTLFCCWRLSILLCSCSLDTGLGGWNPGARPASWLRWRTPSRLPVSLSLSFIFLPEETELDWWWGRPGTLNNICNKNTVTRITSHRSGKRRVESFLNSSISRIHWEIGGTSCQWLWPPAPGPASWSVHTLQGRSGQNSAALQLVRGAACSTALQAWLTAPPLPRVSHAHIPSAFLWNFCRSIGILCHDTE